MGKRTKRTKNLKNVFIAKIGKKTYSNIDEINREQQRLQTLKNSTVKPSDIDGSTFPRGNYSELKIDEQIILTSKILRKLGLKMTYQDGDFLKDKKYK